MSLWMIQLVRVVAVIALLCIAAAVATPKGRLPLALRGLYRIMKRDRGEGAAQGAEQVPTWRKLLAFVLVLAAITIAMVVI